MTYQDFRQVLDVLRQHGELIDVNRPIALNDVGKAMKQSYRRSGPAIMFNQNGTDYPLVAGVYSTRSKALLAFEADDDTIFDKVTTGLHNPIAPTGMSGKAPGHDEVITGDDIDIRRWPIPQYSPKDGGAYITPGIVVSEDPETGIPDIGHYRFLILGKDTFSFSARPFHRFGKPLAKHKRLGTVPKAALVIGVDPILAYTCQVQVPDDTNDWNVAGGLRGAPVELARCVSCDLDVPAAAEVVIEFEVDLNQTVLEGPLGEYTGITRGPRRSRSAASPRSPIVASRSSRGCSPASRSPRTTSSSRCRSRRRSSAPSSASSPPSRRFRCERPPACRSTLSSPCSRATPARRGRSFWRRWRATSVRSGPSWSIPTSTCTAPPRWSGRWRFGCSRSATGSGSRIRRLGRPILRSISARTAPCASRHASASTRRARSASRSTRWPTCQAGRISPCRSWTEAAKRRNGYRLGHSRDDHRRCRRPPRDRPHPHLHLQAPSAAAPRPPS